jgi:1-acyl-sn-glycerol-3-phosphate acyltransferase
MPRIGIQAAQPPLRFIPPDYRPWLHRLFRGLLPLLLRSRGIRRIEVRGAERLARLFAEAQAGRIRLLIAFRHPSTMDPLVMAHLVWRELPRTARSLGLKLRGPVHSQFLYDRGIPLWAGAAAGWILSKLGGIPIQRGKLDRMALRTARDRFAHGPHPLAIAPEGATNNHGEILGPLEPGLAQMAFWCCEDLAGEGRSERVVIVPVGLRYRVIGTDWSPIDRLLAELEHRLALPPQELPRYERLIRIAESLLTLLEHFYSRNYGLPLNSKPPATTGSAEELGFAERLARLREAGLAVAESHFCLVARGSLTERCRRIEQAAWDRMYPEDLQEPSAVERSLADWMAAEAALRMGHMRLVEHFVTVSGTYVAEKPSLDRYGEVLMILWHAIAWILGRDGERPPSLGSRLARVQVGEPIEVSERWSSYQVRRREAVETLTGDLQQSLEDLIGD